MKTIQTFDKEIFNPYKMTNAKIYVNKATKENEVLFEEDFFTENRRPWEIRYDNSYPTVFYDPQINKYRCYYHTFTKDEGSSKYSLEDRVNNQYNPNTSRIVSLCYAESKDGITWEKPNLGLTEWNGSTENNILGHYLHGTSILLDESEKNPNKKYKMYSKLDYGKGIFSATTIVAFSADGLNFDNYIELIGFNPKGDTHNFVYHDKEINKYVLITRDWRDSLRIPCISTSPDFINWSPIKEIGLTTDYNNQVYSMPVFVDGDYRIGLASVFHEGDTLDPVYDTVDLELAYSYKYSGWNYVEAGASFIKRGPGSYLNGSFDNGCIYASVPVKIEDKTYFYYMGGNGQHTNFRETSLARAYIEHDRYSFLGQKDSNKASIAYTNGFIFLSEKIYMDAEIEAGGFIEIELFTFDNKKIEDAIVTLEKVDYRYKINIDKDLNRDRTRMKITFSNAKIYSFEGDLELYRVPSDLNLIRN